MSFPLVSARSLPAAVLGELCCSWCGAGQALSGSVSVCSRSAHLRGILQSQASRDSVAGNGGSAAALPGLSRRIILLCSTACMGLSLGFRAERSPGGRIYDYAVGQKVSKALRLHFTKQSSDRRDSCPDRFDTELLTGAEVLVSPAEPHFLKPSRFLYKKTHFCCSLNPVDIMEES